MYKKVIKMKSRLLYFVKLIDAYSLKYALCNFFSYLGLGSLSNYFFRKKSDYIRNYIDVNFKEIIEKYKARECKIEKAEKMRIWVFWAQGIDNAPDIVKICNKQLNDKNKGYVTNLDMNNYSDFVIMPEYIMEKVNNKIIDLTKFSDMLRVSLLAKHGGLWVDATCWVTCSLQDIIKSISICTLASKTYIIPGIISNGRWSGYFIGTDCLNNTLFSINRDIQYAFWKSSNVIIDYLFIDHIIEYIYVNFENQKQMVDNGAIDGTNRMELGKMLNKPYEEIQFNKLISSSKVFKLSYKYNLLEVNQRGDLTIYGKLKELYLK